MLFYSNGLLYSFRLLLVKYSIGEQVSHLRLIFRSLSWCIARMLRLPWSALSFTPFPSFTSFFHLIRLVGKEHGIIFATIDWSHIMQKEINVKMKKKCRNIGILKQSHLLKSFQYILW